MGPGVQGGKQVGLSVLWTVGGLVYQLEMSVLFPMGKIVKILFPS